MGRTPFLPLDRNAKRILVVGRHADDLGYRCGGWTSTWEGKSGTTILDAIREVTGNETKVICEQNPSGPLIEKDCSFAIVIVGEGPYVESGGDSTELTSHFNGDELISMVAQEIPTLAILISGRPLALDPLLLDKVDALVAAWLPGSEGGGIVDVVFLEIMNSKDDFLSPGLKMSDNSPCMPKTASMILCFQLVLV